MLFRIGLLLSLAAVCLQIAVFLQPLLPKQYQIAPVCETITRALFQPVQVSVNHSNSISAERTHRIKQNQITSDAHVESHQLTVLEHVDHQLSSTAIETSSTHHDHHDANHQCQYCTVLGHLVLPPELSVKEVLVRIQVRLIAFQKAFKHVYFVLQRLFLLPQGRAPPLSA
ncbi:DUF2946 family protein [Acinetobacter shaoyimingii]|uniref:DUF2946 family protein n=1 Tax=Acinetobacter shaoyimingii TaxID=2715164 RepID=UPI003877C4D6